MSIGLKVIHYFDGSDAKCALCQSMTGWYDDRPSKPHPNCDCSIKRYVRFGWYEIRDIKEAMVEYTKLWGKTWYIRNKGDFPVTTEKYTKKFEKTKSWDITAGFEDYVGLGGSGSIGEGDEVQVQPQILPPHSVLNVHIQISGVTTHCCGTKYFVFTFAGEYKEIKIGTVSGGTKQEDQLGESTYEIITTTR